MEYRLLSKYADKESIIHRMDARAKIACALIFVLAVVSMPTKGAGYLPFMTYVILLSVVILFARLPVTYVLKRSMAVAPFIIIPAAAILFVSDGVTVFAVVFAKSWLSSLAMITLVSTTRQADILSGLRAIGVPAIIVTTVSFMYRYLAVLIDELDGMKTARDARSSHGSLRWHMITAGSIIGSLFIRSYGRAERIYAAMLARGYDGTMKAASKFRMTSTDAVLAAVFLATVTMIRVS